MLSTIHRASTRLRTLIRDKGPSFFGLASGPGDPPDRWLAVTIDATAEDIAPGGALPTQLAEFGALVDVDLRPAPGQRGTEVRARPRSGIGGEDQAANEDLGPHLRRALRQLKQVVEVGEVLQAVPRPEGSRPRTLGGLLVDRAERQADGTGAL